MGGMALLFLGVCYYLIEIKNIKWWTQPFLVYGMNAIASFFLSSLMAKLLGIIKLTGADGNEISLKGYIFMNAFSGFSTPMNSSLFFAIFYIVFWYLLMLILYKKKIFIKV
jgi:predicted acyltransferase